MNPIDIDPGAVIASGFIVIALTQQAKRWVSTDFLFFVAVGIGIATQLVNDLLLASEPVTGQMIWFAIVTGFVVGAVAAGAYDVAGRAGTKIPPAEITVDEDWLLDAETSTPPIRGAEEGVVPNRAEDHPERL